MSIQRILTPSGKVRYRVRVKSGGREMSTRVFERRADAVAWEQEQSRQLRHGDWYDPRRGRIPLEHLAERWLASRSSVKRRTRETDAGNWQRYIAPRWAKRQVSSITTSEIASWVGSLIDRGLARATAARALATMRSLMAFAVEDRRIPRNPAAAVRRPSGGRVRREGQALTLNQLHALAAACRGPYADIVLVLGLEGLRWGELVGLQVGDLITTPGPGLRIARAVLSSKGGGQLYIDSVKSQRARTVPIVPSLIPIIQTWTRGKQSEDWIFNAPRGGWLWERNWQRAVHWRDAVATIGRPDLRVHDLRHTAASLWLASGADPKVVQRVLGHASGAMTMDLYGHLLDENLWGAAELVERNGGISGARSAENDPDQDSPGPDETGSD